ncbi:BPI fold-containing family A member 3-like isoform X1 [Macrotis lagotis]|uniref:BPI fold-containing family A member 3-like isoform X1 n=1 Tax=Macrotis lagotis TaxID=92651 RepID=UPI003D687133
MLAWPFSIKLPGMKMLHLSGLILFCCLLTLTPAQQPENTLSNLQAGKKHLGYCWKDKPSKAEKAKDLDSKAILEAYSLYLHKFMGPLSIVTPLLDASKIVKTPSTIITGKLMERAQSNLQEFLELNITNIEFFHIRIQTTKEQHRLSSTILIRFNMEFKVPITKHMILLHVTIIMPAEIKAEKDKKNKIHLALCSCITEDNNLNILIT